MAIADTRKAFAAFLALLRITTSLAAIAPDHTFCVVGAGPGGVQIGQYLSAARDEELHDYMIFERAATPGYFFRKYPKHRELISINKRFHSTGHGQGYAFRQDWNSLIGQPDVPPMTNRTRKFFPDADLLADYIEEFAAKQVEAGRVQLNTSVEHIRKENELFELTLQKGGQQSTVWCKYAIMANGLWTPKNKLANLQKGAELMLGYDDLPAWEDNVDSQEAWRKLFESKDVAIVGLGNAAMEVAQAILPMAASVHMFGRSPERFSDKTHYPGDIRAHRREILDHFQLKMASTYDGSLSGEFGLVRCFNSTKICLLTESEDMEFIASGEGSDLAAGILDLLRQKTSAGTLVEGEDWAHVPGTRIQRDFERALKKSKRVLALWQRLGMPKEVVRSADSLRIRMSALLRNEHADLLDSVLHVRHSLKSDENRDPFDVVVRCTGWKHNTTLYSKSVLPQLMKNGKHAVLTETYESVNVAGLYFAGTLAHGPDFRKSAGGFIHGFRYTSRALTRILEHQRGHDWQDQMRFHLPEDFTSLQEHLLWRIQESSGPYHMFDQLADGITFEPNCSTSYVEEVPKSYFAKAFGKWPRLEWVFQYGQEDDGTLDEEWEENPHVQDAQKAFSDPFLHPILRYYPAGGTAVVHSVHVHADFFTRWSSAVAHVSVVRRFLQFVIKEAYGRGKCKKAASTQTSGRCSTRESGGGGSSSVCTDT